MTIEPALNSLGTAIAPWHLVAEDVARGRLRAAFGFVDSYHFHVVQLVRPRKPKTEHFVKWLGETANQDSRNKVPKRGP